MQAVYISRYFEKVINIFFFISFIWVKELLQYNKKWVYIFFTTNLLKLYYHFTFVYAF